jgi:hypothetical protein
LRRVAGAPAERRCTWSRAAFPFGAGASLARGLSTLAGFNAGKTLTRRPVRFEATQSVRPLVRTLGDHLARRLAQREAVDNRRHQEKAGPLRRSSAASSLRTTRAAT